MKQLLMIFRLLGWLNITPFAQSATIRAASGGLSTIHALLWAPYEQKLMKKYGVDLESWMKSTRVGSSSG